MLGLARKLRKVKFSEILKARLQVETERFYNSKFFEEQLVPVRDKIIESQIQFEQLQAKFELLKSEYHSAKREKLLQIKTEMRLAEIELRANLDKWHVLLSQASVFSPIA